MNIGKKIVQAALLEQPLEIKESINSHLKEIVKCYLSEERKIIAAKKFGLNSKKVNS